MEEEVKVDEVERRILERVKKRKNEEIDHKQMLAEISDDEDEDSEDEAERARREREERRKRILEKHKKSKQKSNSIKAKSSEEKNEKNEDDKAEKTKSEDESQAFDIFSLATMKAPVKDIVEVAASKAKKAEEIMLDTVDDNSTLADNWDDAEGYYRTTIGDMLGGRYRVAKYSGSGVFSTVLMYGREGRDEKGGCTKLFVPTRR